MNMINKIVEFRDPQGSTRTGRVLLIKGSMVTLRVWQFTKKVYATFGADGKPKNKVILGKKVRVSKDRINGVYWFGKIRPIEWD